MSKKKKKSVFGKIIIVLVIVGLIVGGIAGKYWYQNYKVANIEFGPYLEYRLLDNSLLLRAQAGYEAVSYEVFNEGDTLPFRLSAVEFGDDRALLNPEMSGSLFLKIGAIYRFHLDK